MAPYIIFENVLKNVQNSFRKFKIFFLKLLKSQKNFLKSFLKSVKKFLKKLLKSF